MDGVLLGRSRQVMRNAMGVVWLAALLLVTAAAGSRGMLAQNRRAEISRVRAVEPDGGALWAPLGLAYAAPVERFYLVEAGGSAGLRVRSLTAHGEELGVVTLAGVGSEALNLTYDSRGQRLLFMAVGGQELFSLEAGGDGNLSPTTLRRDPVPGWGVGRVQGLAFDAARGHLYVLDRLDGGGLRLLRIAPAGDGGWAGGVVTALALPVPFRQAQGMAYEPASGHLYVAAGATLYEMTREGAVVAARSLAEFGLGEVVGLDFAPSADLTDEETRRHLYVAARRAAEGNAPPVGVETPRLANARYLPLLARGEGTAAKGEAAGQMVELALEAVPLRAQAAAITPYLVQTVDTSQWSPPSPDPSGIAYIPASNTLLAGDGEVEETVTISQSGQLTDVTLYAGVNMWHITPAGAVVSTWTTLSFSDEPVGLALNSANGHLFVSDDTGSRIVYEVDPGADGIYGNGNDVITSFVTGTFGGSQGFGSLDPEGLDYAADLGVLFIVDGTNNQVYRVSPGINAVFDGVPPAGDDQVTDFDIAILGVTEPEGIAYNPDTGNLFIVGSNDDLLFEVTTAGVLVQTYDLSALQATSLAGLTLAPGSQNPSTMSIYIVDRGVDNNFPPDRLPNDGRLYEISLAPLANDDSAVTDEDTPTSIDAAANDGDPDGNLLPASANTGCAGCSVPANGALINNGDGSFGYTPNADFNGADGFVYEICDSLAACDTATVALTVNAVNDPPVAVDDSAVTGEDTPVTIAVAANDMDVDDNLLPASANTTCAAGSAGCNDAANGALTNNGDGSFGYTPNADFNGADGFVYEICDSLAACDTAIATITVDAVDDPPLANDDNVVTSENTPVTIDAAANDGDPDGNLVPNSANTTCGGCLIPSDGVLTNNGGGSFGYTPNANFNGSDSFIYEICDSLAACDTAIVTITVTSINVAPVVVDDSAVTSEDTPVTIDAAANDMDVDDNLAPGSANTACAACTASSYGVVVNNGDGSFGYTPNLGFTGVDSFVYQICDTGNLCDTAAVTITINPVNAPPVAIDDSAVTDEDTPVTIAVAANDTDVDGNLVPASANTGCAGCSIPSDGVLTNNGDGSFGYTPNADFSGADSFVYEICDSLAACDIAAVTITVTITVNGSSVLYLPLME
ncbi:MAG: tandem-95 repeat protein [Caldilineaceae bacterium]|nr:tandem-95 repeat protein [Caldilineaceae bacterium]